jgi:hypothetical protein
VMGRRRKAVGPFFTAKFCRHCNARDCSIELRQLREVGRSLLSFGLQVSLSASSNELCDHA